MPFANNNGVRIHYELQGPLNGPPLILQHGFGSGIYNWTERGDYLKELGKSYRLIIMEARGHGESDKPHDLAGYRADVIANDYVAVLDDLKIKQAMYFGYSLGAIIGYKTVCRYALPRFYAMILGGASALGSQAEAEKKELALRLGGLKMAVEKGMEAYIVNFTEKTYGPMEKTARERMLKNDPQALLSFRQEIEEWPSGADILPKIKIPILAFAGEADPRFPTIKQTVAALPNVTFFSLPGLNHGQCFEHSELTLPHIIKFLASVNKK
jgi:pimeloyl-ACP methyl ester carboxylesterase